MLIDGCHGRRLAPLFAGKRWYLACYGALTEFERNLIRERTVAGLTAARARGRRGGRRPVLDAAKWALAVRLYEEKTLPIAKICSTMGISKPTLYAYVNAAKEAGQT